MLNTLEQLLHVIYQQQMHTTFFGQQTISIIPLKIEVYKYKLNDSLFGDKKGPALQCLFIHFLNVNYKSS